jgi:serine phosphatase RsbU (regulator of sigma subunit)
MEIRGGSRAAEESFATPGLDAWLYSSPFQGADRGGDLHYVSLCGGVITRVVVADVSGHGAQVASFSEALRLLMRKHINSKSQTRLVQSINRQFGESTGSLRFATAVIATYLATKRTLTVCNAGHPRPLWFREASRGWELLTRQTSSAGNLPLGLDEESSYNQFTVMLDPGDILLFYTDALTEAFDPAGRMLGEEGLLALAQSLDVGQPARIASSLLAGVERHRGGRPADDDVTLLALLHTGSGPRPPSLGEKLHVYAKVFGMESV